jgi:hypothetical protein
VFDIVDGGFVASRRRTLRDSGSGFGGDINGAGSFAFLLGQLLSCRFRSLGDRCVSGFNRYGRVIPHSRSDCRRRIVRRSAQSLLVGIRRSEDTRAGGPKFSLSMLKGHLGSA